MMGEDRTFTFSVPGEVVGQGRPRACVRGLHASVYEDPKSRSYKGLIQLHASKAWTDGGFHLPAESPARGYRVWITVMRRIPKGFSKKKRELALGGWIRPKVKPDLDNVAKAVLDALTGIVWRDDTEVAEISVGRWYAETDSLKVSIEWEEE